MALPTVNIAPFLSESTPDERKKCADSISSVCTEWGFFYVTGYKDLFSNEEAQNVLDQVRSFFALPAEEKKKIKIRPGDSARGYQVLGENVTRYAADHHEGIDYYRPWGPGGDPSKLLQGPNQWPESPEAFKPTFDSWIPKMKTLGLALMKASALGLGMDPGSSQYADFLKLFDDSFWSMRCIGYPPLPEGAPGKSCGIHSDYGCYTLLLADDTKGALQVFHVDDGGEDVLDGKWGTWISADPRPGHLVVNIGDMWPIWSGGRYSSTLHQVVHRGTNYRVSVPFFFEPNWDAEIRPLVGDSTIAPVKYGDFLSKKVSGNFEFTDADDKKTTN